MSGTGSDDLPEGDEPDMAPGMADDLMPPEADSDVIDTEDGGAIVTLSDEDEDEEPEDSDFSENLALVIPETDLQRIATQYLELVDRDKEARKKRDELYEDGLRRTGLGKDAPGGADFQGASKVVHPLLLEASIDFSSRAMKELMPPAGPAKDFIPGQPTQQKIKKARRKTAFMNWQLTVQSKTFRPELEQLLTQTPLGGVQYLKINWLSDRNRPDFMTVYVDDMLIPFSASSFYSAQRKTHVQYLTQLDYEQKVRSGMYRDADLIPASADPEETSAQKANDKIEGKTSTTYNEDGLRTVYEIYALTNIEQDAKGQESPDPSSKVGPAPSPYIITIDKLTSKVLAIYRNWDEDDDSREELEWFVEFPFVPWRGAMAIGLPHMIGGLAAASTGALRALLDAAQIANSQTMLKLKSTGSRGGQSLDIQPTQVMEIEGGLNTDDIRKLAMPLPFNPPSPVLYQLLGTLVDAAKGVVRTTLEDAVDGDANAPVGTTMARLEQGMVVFSAIHSRLHASMARVLTILNRLNGMYLDDAKTDKSLGEILAKRADFQGPMDVVPVSDPNIFSEAQRFAQVQAIAQRSGLNPALYNQRKVEERILDTLKIPNAKDLLNPAVEPKEQNAVNENVAASMGRPIVAFPEQDHIAHLKTHMGYMLSPIFGGSQLMAPAFLPRMIQHIKEHIALWYASTVFSVGNEHSTLGDIGDAMKGNKSAEDRQSFDRMLAEASENAVVAGDELFGRLPPVIAQAMTMAQQLAPPMPVDPAQVAAQDVQRKAQDDAASAKLESDKLQVKNQEVQADAAADARKDQIKAMEVQQDARTDAQKLEQQARESQADRLADMAEVQTREAAEDDRTALEVDARLAMNREDNITATTLAELEVATGERIAVSTGTGINP